jgi:hypothetical protein
MICPDSGVPGSLVGEKEPTMRVTSRHTATRPAANAESLLGRGHPLARVSDRRGSRQRQLVGVGVVLLCGVVVQLSGVGSAGSLITAAMVVEAALTCSLLLAVRDERRLARELIIAGRDTLPLPAVVSERRRLAEPTYRYRLARSLDRTRETAERPQWLLRGSRPLFQLHVVAAVSPELTELAAALRETECTAAGIAMTERLLCDSDSPLYGDDIARLRARLLQIRLRLGS